jgi:hypothetical protein
VTARTTAAALVAVALAASGCGEGDGDPEPKPPPPQVQQNSDARVIRRWSDELRQGHVDAATALFAVPATIANGTAPTQLISRSEIAAFNDSLPCGARLLYTTRRAPYTIGTFRLTNRPGGGGCGPGTGEKAATAFRIERGRIVEWLRVPIPPPQREPEV